eukprot:scaffold1714_cov111-Isochrysis_galbana.AAC.9
MSRSSGYRYRILKDERTCAHVTHTCDRTIHDTIRHSVSHSHAIAGSPNWEGTIAPPERTIASGHSPAASRQSPPRISRTAAPVVPLQRIPAKKTTFHWIGGRCSASSASSAHPVPNLLPYRQPAAVRSGFLAIPWGSLPLYEGILQRGYY